MSSLRVRILPQLRTWQAAEVILHCFPGCFSTGITLTEDTARLLFACFLAILQPAPPPPIRTAVSPAVSHWTRRCAQDQAKARDPKELPAALDQVRKKIAELERQLRARPRGDSLRSEPVRICLIASKGLALLIEINTAAPAPVPVAVAQGLLAKAAARLP